MSDTKHTPAHRVYAIRPRGADKKAYWTEIGCTWANSDGSFNIALELIPADPGITIQARPYQEPKKSGEDEQD